MTLLEIVSYIVILISIGVAAYFGYIYWHKKKQNESTPGNAPSDKPPIAPPDTAGGQTKTYYSDIYELENNTANPDNATALDVLNVPWKYIYTKKASGKIYVKGVYYNYKSVPAVKGGYCHSRMGMQFYPAFATNTGVVKGGFDDLPCDPDGIITRFSSNGGSCVDRAKTVTKESDIAANERGFLSTKGCMTVREQPGYYVCPNDRVCYKPLSITLKPGECYDFETRNTTPASSVKDKCTPGKGNETGYNVCGPHVLCRPA